MLEFLRFSIRLDIIIFVVEIWNLCRAANAMSKKNVNKTCRCVGVWVKNDF